LKTVHCVCQRKDRAYERGGQDRAEGGQLYEESSRELHQKVVQRNENLTDSRGGGLESKHDTAKNSCTFGGECAKGVARRSVGLGQRKIGIFALRNERGGDGMGGREKELKGYPEMGVTWRRCRRGGLNFRRGTGSCWGEGKGTSGDRGPVRSAKSPIRCGRGVWG